MEVHRKAICAGREAMKTRWDRCKQMLEDAAGIVAGVKGRFVEHSPFNVSQWKMQENEGRDMQ